MYQNTKMSTCPNHAAAYGPMGNAAAYGPMGHAAAYGPMGHAAAK